MPGFLSEPTIPDELACLSHLHTIDVRCRSLGRNWSPCMSPSLESLGIDRLSVEDRIALAEKIWESVEAEQPLLTEAQRRELKRRLKEHEANPKDVVPGRRSGTRPLRGTADNERARRLSSGGAS